MHKLVALALFALCALIGGVYAKWTPGHSDLSEADGAAHLAQVRMPSPSLAPDEVVQLQVDALHRFANEPAAIEQCYVLASLANRAVTGPLDRFGAMVVSPDYRDLVFGSKALVGRPRILEDRALVLVSVLTAQRAPKFFYFYLSKQSEPPHENCWMTDIVASPPPARQQNAVSAQSPDV